MSLTAASVSAALGTPVRGVDVVQTFAASAAEVARVLVRTGSSDRTVIAKLATGDGLAAARREVHFFEQLAPGWPHPAPQYLGCYDTGDAVLLLTEDLEQTGYRVVGTAVSNEQLYGAIDVLAGVHAHFWNWSETPAFEPSVTSSAQAWPPEAITRHAAAVRRAADEFFAGTTELTRSERAVLDDVLAAWGPRFQDRVAGRQHLTLIHGDFHFLGNVFFGAGNPRPKVIDWSELKPGLAAHDLAYSLSALPSRQRDATDLLRHYWKALDVPDYSWELCSWDFRFSVFSNLFQSVFQQSVKWYRASLTALDALDSRSSVP
ncbi:aminoglycoside phosphotransferase family protein [Kribbella sp. WER1]